MPPRRQNRSEVSETDGKKRRPATTLEGREAQLVELADRLAERQLREGTASSQVITHYLKLGTTRERLEQERLRREISLMEAKEEAMASAIKVEEMYKEALEAMRSYGGMSAGDYND